MDRGDMIAYLVFGTLSPNSEHMIIEMALEWQATLQELQSKKSFYL